MPSLHVICGLGPPQSKLLAMPMVLRFEEDAALKIFTEVIIKLWFDFSATKLDLYVLQLKQVSMWRVGIDHPFPRHSLKTEARPVQGFG